VKPSLIPFEPHNASEINTPDAGESASITHPIAEPCSISVGEARPRYNRSIEPYFILKLAVKRELRKVILFKSELIGLLLL
jgi:hypothetical protein